jgi:hypothetical protein
MLANLWTFSDEWLIFAKGSRRREISPEIPREVLDPGARFGDGEENGVAGLRLELRLAVGLIAVSDVAALLNAPRRG